MRTEILTAAAWWCALTLGALGVAAAAPVPGAPDAVCADRPCPGDRGDLVTAKAPKKQKAQPKKEKAKEKADDKGRPEPAKGAEKPAAKPEDKGGTAAAQGPEAGPMLQRSNRLEFDARLIQGQLAKSGAIFLFERAPRPLPPLLKLRRSYLRDIVDTELGTDYMRPQK